MTEALRSHGANGIAARIRAGLPRGVPHELLIFALVLVNGLASAPRGVMLDDDGYFILEAYFNGVAHPPGYPLYTFLAHCATLVPLGSVAFRVHALSVLFAAGAAAVLWMLARRLLRSAVLAYLPALAFAWSDVFWSQSIVAEVYSLNAFLFFVLLLLCMDFGRNGGRRGHDRRPFWIALIYGLALSNHWPLTILASPALVLALWPRRREFMDHWPLLATSGILGLTPYLWMVVHSRFSQVSFYGPITSWHDFWYYLSRKPYHVVDQSASASLADKAHFGWFVLKQSALQFGPFGGAFVALGLVRQWWTWPRPLCWGLLLGYLGGTAVLIALLGFDYDFLHRNVFRVYPVLSYGICALWLGLGAQSLVEWLLPRVRGRVNEEFLYRGVVMLLVGTTWLSGAGANFRPGDRWATNYAETVLQTLPGNAILFTFGDYMTGPVGYLNLVEKLRPDITLYNVQAQLFSNRLYSAYLLDRPEMQVQIDRLVSSSSRPVYYFLHLPHSGGSADYGLYSRVLKYRADDARKTVLIPAIRQYFETLMERGPPDEPSELMHYRLLNALYCGVLASLQSHAGSAMRDGLAQRIVLRCGGLQALIQRISIMLLSTRPPAGKILRMLHLAAAERNQAVSNQDLAMVEYLFGRAEMLRHRAPAARQHFRRSLALWADPENPAHRYEGKAWDRGDPPPG